MVSVGTSRVAGSQAFRVKKGQRFITNPNTASMGFCLRQRPESVSHSPENQ